MLPENDRWSETRSQLLAQMDVSMGGRVAEEIIFGAEYITTGKKEEFFKVAIVHIVKYQLFFFFFAGASSDFDTATKIARLMVTRYGMCEKVCELRRKPAQENNLCISQSLLFIGFLPRYLVGCDDLCGHDRTEPRDTGCCGA